MFSDPVRSRIPRFLITQAVVAAIWSLARATPSPTAAVPDSPASLSVGSCHDGQLIGGVELPATAEGLKRMSVVAQRHTGFGTQRLVRLVVQTAAALQSVPEHLGVPLRVGNLSRREGGAFRWSHSHRSGRDVDLALYALDRKGRPAAPDRFLRFDGDGRAKSGRSRYGFDEPRNWNLVRTLLEAEGVDLAHIYIAEPLRRRLLVHARSIGEPEWLLQRASQVLQEPLHAGRHDDHFHIRLFCSLDEILAGCIDETPRWPWVPDHRRERQAIAALAIARLGEADAVKRVDAANLLGPLHDRDPAATDALVWAAGFDADVQVRAAASRALVTHPAARALPGLLRAAAAQLDGARAMDLLRTAVAAARRDDAHVLIGLLGEDSGGFGARTTLAMRSELRRLVARRLRPWMAESAAAPLVAVLRDPDPTTRRAALRTLEHLANRRFEGPDLAAAWYEGAAGAGRMRWMIESFHDMGVPIDAPPHVLIPVLLGLLDRADEVLVHNAEVMLDHVSGGAQVAYVPTPPRRLRAWQRWWQVSRKRYLWPSAGLAMRVAPDPDRLVAR